MSKQTDLRGLLTFLVTPTKADGAIDGEIGGHFLMSVVNKIQDYNFTKTT